MLSFPVFLNSVWEDGAASIRGGPCPRLILSANALLVTPEVWLTSVLAISSSHQADEISTQAPPDIRLRPVAP